MYVFKFNEEYPHLIIFGRVLKFPDTFLKGIPGRHLLEIQLPFRAAPPHDCWWRRLVGRSPACLVTWGRLLALTQRASVLSRNQAVVNHLALINGFHLLVSRSDMGVLSQEYFVHAFGRFPKEMRKLMYPLKLFGI